MAKFKIGDKVLWQPTSPNSVKYFPQFIGKPLDVDITNGLGSMVLRDPATRSSISVLESECSLYGGSFTQALANAIAAIPVPMFPTYGVAPHAVTVPPPTQVPTTYYVSSTKIKKCTCNIRDLMSDTGHVKGCSKL